VDGVERKIWTEKPYETSIDDLSDGPHVLKFKATDKDGNSTEKESRIGVNTAWDYIPTTTVVSTGITTSSIGITTP
jgi:hypothetical protein